ncbi:MAG: hypothetical protein RLZZ515_2506, partial [Cyanobacteriota bacterium]
RLLRREGWSVNNMRVCPVSIRLMGGVNLVDRWNQAP